MIEHKDKHGNENMIEGRNAVLEAFRSGKPVDKLFVLDGCQDGPVRTIVREAKKHDTLVQFVDKERLTQLSQTGRHQGVIAYTAAYEYAQVEDMLALAKERGEDPFLILLDDIEDPHNLGAIIRTANLAGAHGVIIPKRRAVGLTATVAKTSAGAINYTPVAKVTNLSAVIEELKKRGMWFVCADMEGDRMYDLNLTYFKELSMYILAGKKKLEEVRSTQLAELMSKAQVSGLPEDAQAAKDLDSMCNRFEKKLHDLELTRMISIQTAPQIRLVQNNDTQMVEKIQSTIVNTIPLWKSQMLLALGVEHSSQAAAAQRQVTDMTNELLKKNAETLKMSTIETAKESERGIADLETLKATNESLISTLDEVMNIQREGREKRREAEAELRNMENELKAKLLEIRG